MSTWNAAHYLKFGDQRTRAAADLAARVALDCPRVIVDLGCGPGNSAQVLRSRWPQSKVVGIDSSPEMIDVAKRSFPQQDWVLADAIAWTPETPVNLLYSNAALQWMPQHDELIPRLFHLVAPGGAFAFQIPSGTYALIRTIIHDISRDATWTARMNGPRSALTMESPSFYYDLLAKNAREIDLWETEYQHVMESHAAIIDWISSTGLRPFLAALDTEGERQDFLAELLRRVSEAYETRTDGKVLFPFRRTFVIAYQ